MALFANLEKLLRNAFDSSVDAYWAPARGAQERILFV